MRLDNRAFDTSNLNFARENKDENVGKRAAPIALDETGPVPDSFDWRDYGVVPSIKHQGDCWSCYAFAFTDAMDALHKIKYGIMLGISPQPLIDCIPYPADQLEIADKCKRVVKEADILRFLKAKGMRLLEDYPYTGKGGDCRSSTTRRIDIQFKIHEIKNNEETMKDAVYRRGPVIAVLQQGRTFPEFQLYGDGVYENNECDNPLVTVVLIVGYGRDKANREYWIVKFSFGKYFGKDGYILIARNNNTCHIGEKAFSLELISSSEAYQREFLPFHLT